MPLVVWRVLDHLKKPVMLATLFVREGWGKG